MIAAIGRRHRLRFADTFTRADGAMGSGDSGQLYVFDGGQLTIISNQCGSSDTAYRRAHVAGMPADVVMAVDVVIVGATGRQIFEARYTDGSNFWRAGNIGNAWTLTKIVAGSETTVGTGTGTPANGDRLRLEMMGSAIAFYVNDVLKISATDAFNAAVARHGLAISGLSTPRLDNFSIRRAA